MYLHVDLCCGLGGWQAPFKESDEWRSVGVDIRDDLAADVIGDVRHLPIDTSPTLLTASPPCEAYSTAWNRWCPLPERDPDMSVWTACVAAADHLNPDWWVLENVGGAQHFHGPADKTCYPWFLWGRFPPFDVPDLRSKGETWRQDPQETARIPYPLADALRHAVETWS